MRLLKLDSAKHDKCDWNAQSRQFYAQLDAYDTRCDLILEAVAGAGSLDAMADVPGVDRCFIAHWGAAGSGER